MTRNGNDDELLRALVAKYGPEPPHGLAAHYVSSLPQESNHALESVMYAWRGRENALLESVGNHTTASDSCVDTALRSQHRARVLRTQSRRSRWRLSVGTIAARVEGQGPSEVGKTIVEASGCAEAPMPRSEARRRLMAHYAAADPSMLAEVDDVLDDYTGRYGDLFMELGVDRGVSRGATQSRLSALYACHRPENLRRIPEFLQRFDGRYAELIEAVVNKYGDCELTLSFARAETEPTPAALSLRDRVARMYEAHVPQRLGGVEAVLLKYEGREQALLDALIQKYGPEPSGGTDGRTTVQAKPGEAERRA